MRFGVAIPTSMEGLMYPIPFFNSVLEVVKMCQEAEALGFDSVWGNEHITRQRYVKGRWSKLPRYFEPITVLSYVAAKTEKIKLGIGLIPLPLRDPVLLARQASTLDNLSMGRLILGVGLGAYREEFDAQNPRYARMSRGEMLDEALEAMIELLTKSKATFKGKYYSFSGLELSPKPVQVQLPIYIGGNAANSIRRAAKYGIGWFPAGLTPREIKDGVSKLMKYSRDYEKDFSKIDVAPQLTVCIAETHEGAIRKYRNSQIYGHDLSLRNSTFKQQAVENLEERDLIGTINEITEKIETYRKVGVDHLPALIFVGKNIDDVLEGMRLFAREIMSSFK